MVELERKYLDGRVYHGYAGAYSSLSNAPKDGTASGSWYLCVDSSNVGKVYLFSEEDNDWNEAFTLGS